MKKLLGGLLFLGAAMFVAVPVVFADVGHTYEEASTAAMQTYDSVAIDSTMPDDFEAFAIYGPKKPWML